MNFLEDEKGKSTESNVVQKLCNETRNTMNLSFACITSINYTEKSDRMGIKKERIGGSVGASSDEFI